MMEDSAIEAERSDLSTTSKAKSLLPRTITFQPARKSIAHSIVGGGDFRLETLNPGSETLRAGHSSGKKSDGSEVFENGLDPELSFGITFRRIGAGLENLGNTCFLNSVLQCLTYTEPFAAYLQSGKHQNSCRVVGFCALCAIQKHVSRALQSTGRILAPKDLVSNLRCISRNFRNSRQEDAHEYMVHLLESMHKCCLPSGVLSESPNAYEKSLVQKIFGGCLRSQVKCMECSYSSNKFDPFLDLSLEIVKADSLHKALVHFTAAEQLDGGERQYQCQRCKHKVRALKQLTVHKAPYVLTIHLKRFAAHDPGRKIDKKVLFGPTLDFKPFVSGSYEGELKYTLYGVLVHAGWSTHSGHYYCFVRTSSGMWYSLDDNRVVQVNERTVLDQKAYMLFYVRDRKNFSYKKPVDVQVEATGSHSVGNKIHSSCNRGLKETVQNGPIERQLNGVVASAVMARKDVLKVGLSKEVMLKETPVLKSSSPAIADSSTLKKDFLLEPSSKVPFLHPVNGLSVLKPNLEERSSLLPQTVQVNIVSTAEDQSIALSTSLSVVPLEKNECLRLPKRPSSKKSQVESIPSETTATESVSEEATRSVQGLVVESIKSSRIPTNGSLDVKSAGFTVQRKLKMKFLKLGVVRSIHFGSNMFFRASLGRRKKKKHKGRRRNPLCSKNVSKWNLFDGTTDIGPSTSEKTKTEVSLNSRKIQRNRCKSKSAEVALVVTASDLLNASDDSVGRTVDGEFRGRIDQSGSVLATDKPPQTNGLSSNIGNLLDMQKPKVLKDSGRVSMQNGLMNMLTRGLEETTVARWDEMEVGPSQIIESSDVKSFRIGYVPDEWDEEYDRGKRKKVRQAKDNFDGLNPFQEIASKKAQFKRLKMDQSSSGNRPFRL